MSPLRDRPSARALAAAARAVALRTPLARVELVASRLAGEADTRPLAERLSEAVAEIDRGIAETLAVLIPRPARARRALASDLLEVVRARVVPSLRARGVAWLPARKGAARVMAPAGWLREAAVALAGDAATAHGPGTRIRIAPVLGTGEASGIALTVSARSASPEAEPAFPTAGALALRLGGRLSCDGEGGATLWWPEEAPAETRETGETGEGVGGSSACAAS